MRLNPDKNSRGSFITIYGANNLGKSTQVGKLVTNLVESGHQSFLLIKYPIYELYPTGHIINDILRGDNLHGTDPKSIEMQKLYAQNRFDFQPALLELLNSGIDVICEDYVGTGIAWGMTWGLKQKDIQNLNYGLIQPDYEILLDGKRFKSAIEKGHRFEDGGDLVWEKTRKIYLKLAKAYKWKVFIANQNADILSQEIWAYVTHAFDHMYKTIKKK